MEWAQTGRYRLICFTDAGRKIMCALLDCLSQEDENYISPVSSLFQWTKKYFIKGNILVFIGACGIAVRAIAPFVFDKTKDPAVIVIDEAGQFVIPILAGHIGGANKASKTIAKLIGAVPVITTATDIRGEFAIDVFASENDLAISDMKLAKEFSAKLLKGEDTAFTVSPRIHADKSLYLIPRCLIVGIGCKKGKSAKELMEFLGDCLYEKGYDIRSIKAIVSIDLKKEEPGLVELTEKLMVPLITYSADELMVVQGEFESSDFTLATTGADNVCERAVAAYGVKRFVQKKTTKNGMTLAIGTREEAVE